VAERNEDVKITVKLYGVFRIGRFKEELRDCAPGASPRDVTAQLGIPLQLLGTVLIKGVHAGLDDRLAEGDDLSLLPILGGG
jgi:molybdopterin converting factor small subunit